MPGKQKTGASGPLQAASGSDAAGHGAAPENPPQRDTAQERTVTPDFACNRIREQESAQACAQESNAAPSATQEPAAQSQSGTVPDDRANSPQTDADTVPASAAQEPGGTNTLASQKMDIPPADLRALQQKGLELLLYFQEICEREGLLFYLCGGCLIGALRYGGFIPWDDDVDVFMPRPDYERLAQIWDKVADSERYSYVRTTKGHYTRLMHAAINDNETTFIKIRQQDLDTPHGVRLEIIPIDGCPSGRIRRKIQMLWALLYQVYNVGEPPSSRGRLASFIGRVLLALAPTPRARYRFWRLAEKRMSKYNFWECEKTTELVTRYHYMVNEYPAEAFRSAVLHEFEGHMVPIPKGYDAYLSMAFGDYMTPPPPDAQYAKHEVVYYDLQHSYRDYKGVYYARPDENAPSAGHGG